MGIIKEKYGGDLKRDASLKEVFEVVWTALRDRSLRYFFGCFLIIIGMTPLLIQPIILASFIDFFLNYSVGDSLSKFYLLCLGFFLVHVVGTFIRMAGKKLAAGEALEARYNLKVGAIDRLLGFSLSWHEKENIGSKIAKVGAASDGVRNLLRIFSHNFTNIIVSFVGIPFTLLFFDVRVFYFFVVYILIIAAIEYYFEIKLYNANIERRRITEMASGVLYDTSSNITTIKTHGSKQSVSGTISSNEALLKEKSMSIRDLNVRKTSTIQYCNGMFLGSFMFFVGYGVVGGSITLGAIAAYYAYLNTIKHKVWDIADFIPSFIVAITNISGVVPFFALEEKKYFGKKKFPVKWKKIAFESNSFSYGSEVDEERKQALNSVKFEVPRGKSVAFVGVSGSGKSTIGKLLLGLYELKDGGIFVDGNNYYSYSHESLLKTITAVNQETELMNVSLAENITMYGALNKKKLNKVIELSQLSSLIKRMPEGYNTVVGEKGYKLSGGERQRVGLARALYKESDVILLDEATSALDNKTEKKVLGSFSKMKGKTFVVIAHRLTTIKDVDVIYVMSKGKLVEFGAFDELLKKKGHFYKLYSAK